MDVLGLRRGVLRGILGRRRGANGAFYRGIPGVLDGARVRCGDSAHGGHGRANWAKKFFKKLKKGANKPKNWGARGAERWSEGTLYRACGGGF